MIAYKWCIKEDNKYYPLINYRIHPAIKEKSYPYEIGKTYSDPKDLLFEYYKLAKAKGYSTCRNPMNLKGFFCWHTSQPQQEWDRFNTCLTQKKQPKINSILKCRIYKKDIIVQNRMVGIKVKKFKVLEEVKINLDI